MGIASAIVRAHVFSKVSQHCTVVRNGRSLATLLGLVRALDCETVVLCRGSIAALRHELLEAGAEADGAACVRMSTRRLVLVAEVEESALVKGKADPLGDVEDSRGSVIEVEATPPCEVEATPPCEVNVPAEAVGAGLIVVYGSPLREAASLSKVICAVRMGQSQSAATAHLEVFHLVSDLQQVLMET